MKEFLDKAWLKVEPFLESIFVKKKGTSLIIVLVSILIMAVVLFSILKKQQVFQKESIASKEISTDEEKFSNLTLNQFNAIVKARNYLDKKDFSHKDLINQLIIDGFNESDARYGVNNCGEDWKYQEMYNQTLSQINAEEMARNYLNTTAFSYKGLINQLIYEGFGESDARYGADNCGADWEFQASQKAKDYLINQPFSRKGLINQLIYEGFTEKEAVYGVNNTGL